MKLPYGEEKIEIKSRLPVIPLRDIVIFPHMVYPILVGRSFTVSALQEAMVLDKQVFLCAQKRPEIDLPRKSDLHQVGVVARILQVMKLPNGTMKVLVEGLARARMTLLTRTGEFYTARVQAVSPDIRYDKEIEALARTVRELFAEYIHLNRRLPDEVLLSFAGIDDYPRLADTVAAHILQTMGVKQSILELAGVKSQFEKIISILQSEVEILKIEQRIDGSV
ncbi:MAG: LON peptidase substrate-binding domain-containing protein, partial [Candidatus Zixiibacteriota bacterium]